MSQSRTTSLRTRITSLSQMLALTAIALVGVVFYVFEQQSLRRSQLEGLGALGTMLAANLEVAVEFGDQEITNRTLGRALDVDGVQAVRVIDWRGNVLAIAGDPTVLPSGLDIGGDLGNSCLVSVPLPYRDDRGLSRAGRVQVVGDSRALRDRLQELMMVFAGAGLLAAVGLFVSLRTFLVRFFRPLAELLHTTRRVRDDRDYNVRARGAGADEIGMLVESFNAMLDGIQARDARLGQSRADLEQQVQRRTEELRRAVTAAEQAASAKSSFLANMSHEIRTPLNAVIGMTDLAMDCGNPQEQREYLQVVRSAGQNLLGILNDILDLSKIESGKLEITPVVADLEEMAVSTLRPLTARVQSRDLELALIIDPNLAGSYRFDDVRLRQILTNLVGNAIKFTERGMVTVKVDRMPPAASGERICISVADTGVGIPRDRLDAIFSPFTQADSTITRRFAGTGLGLTICRHLAQLMGGDISVESEVGVGSTFRVWIPVGTVTPAVAPPALPRGLRVAVVSHAPGVRGAFQCFAAGGVIDLQVFARWDDLTAAWRDGGDGFCPQLVVLDNREDHDDVALAARSTRLPSGRLPVLLLSSYHDLALTMQRCDERAFGGYLLKPLSMREFVLETQALLGGPVAEPATPATANAPAPTLRILVAEDNAVNQRLIERLLQRDGHEVTMTSNGKMCLQAYEPGRFDLVLLDMQMPVMSGIEASLRIRRQEAGTGRRVPILALTANAGIEDRDACLNAGMDEVLTKPVVIDKLRAALQRNRKGAGPGSAGGGNA